MVSNYRFYGGAIQRTFSLTWGGDSAYGGGRFSVDNFVNGPTYPQAWTSCPIPPD